MHTLSILTLPGPRCLQHPAGESDIPTFQLPTGREHKAMVCSEVPSKFCAQTVTHATILPSRISPCGLSLAVHKRTRAAMPMARDSVWQVAMIISLTPPPRLL